jgi:hypothetical protein
MLLFWSLRRSLSLLWLSILIYIDYQDWIHALLEWGRELLVLPYVLVSRLKRGGLSALLFLFLATVPYGLMIRRCGLVAGLWGQEIELTGLNESVDPVLSHQPLITVINARRLYIEHEWVVLMGGLRSLGVVGQHSEGKGDVFLSRSVHERRLLSFALYISLQGVSHDIISTSTAIPQLWVVVVGHAFFNLGVKAGLGRLKFWFFGHRC